MSGPSPATWHEANQRYLAEALGMLRNSLERAAGDDPASIDAEMWPEARSELSPPPAIATLAQAFGLSSFERALLLLCAGVELDTALAAACERLLGQPGRCQPTFGLALALLPDAHWSALTPAAPLRRWRLIEISDDASLTRSPLRIDERVLHFLTGVHYLDERLSGVVERLGADEAVLPPSQQRVVEQIVAAWSLPDIALPPVIQLTGQRRAAEQVLAVACARLGIAASVMRAESIPAGAAEREELIRLWEREAVLGSSILLVDAEAIDRADPARLTPLLRFLERVASPVAVAAREPLRLDSRQTVVLPVARPTREERHELWRAALGPRLGRLNSHLDRFVDQFALDGEEIRSATLEVAVQTQDGDDGFETALWESCRVRQRPHLDQLAQRMDGAATWDDLVLPAAQRQTLREVAIHVRQRTRVYQTWGFGRKGQRGLGISALFSGPSGAGKTLAAEVLADELRLDLYRIDLSQVVSKYIGETEKNLARLFDAAEGAGVILLFDEADALFGKRSEVRDSHDRYANIEVSYLLQRMEAYDGLAILTTNLKGALDPAFLRRIRFVVQFPFPNAEQRGEIWRRIFPADTPTADLRVDRLARLNVTGGNIRNIAMNAAFLAAETGEPVGMAHLLQAARAEHTKLERTLSDAETRDWV
jgi:hypothetical protein